MSDSITYSVVVPVYNSEKSLNELCTRIVKTLSPFTFEIILVDDSSTDKSWQIIDQLKTEYPAIIKAIQLQMNYGQLAASLCAFSFCKGDFTITIDDDLQFAPEDILLLIEKQKELNCDVVYGTPPKKKQSYIRNLGGRFIQFISKVFEGRDNRGSSFRLITKKTVLLLTGHHKNSFISIDNLLTWYTSSFAFVKVSHRPRSSGKSGYNIIKLTKLYLNVIINHSTIPLKLMTQVGFFFSAIFFLAGIRFIYKKIFQHVPAGYTSIIVTILFCSSIIIFCLGVIGQYIFKMYITQENKPLYNIKRII